MQYILPLYKKSLSKNQLLILVLTYDLFICDFQSQTYTKHATSPALFICRHAICIAIRGICITIIQEMIVKDSTDDISLNYDLSFKVKLIQIMLYILYYCPYRFNLFYRHTGNHGQGIYWRYWFWPIDIYMIFSSRSSVTFKVKHIKNILYLLYYCLRDAVCVTIIQEIMVKESTGDISFDLLMYMSSFSR